MMGLPTCEEVDQFAYDFLEGQLDPETTRQVERHLKTCKNCQKFIESYGRVAKQARLETPPPLDIELREKMFQFLKNKGERHD